jgi:peptide/nickel transport system substrate-binding protein
MPGHSPSIGLNFDPLHARELLDAAGYADRGHFPELTAVAWPGVAPVCDALSAAWRENLGIRIEWRLLDFAEFLQARYDQRTSISLTGIRCDYPDAGLQLDQLVTPSLFRCSNAEFLDCFARAQKNPDPAERLALLAQADAIAMSEAGVMPLYYERLQFLIKPHIRRYPLSPANWWFWRDVEIQ